MMAWKIALLCVDFLAACIAITLELTVMQHGDLGGHHESTSPSGNQEGLVGHDGSPGRMISGRLPQNASLARQDMEIGIISRCGQGMVESCMGNRYWKQNWNGGVLMHG